MAPRSLQHVPSKTLTAWKVAQGYKGVEGMAVVTAPQLKIGAS